MNTITKGILAVLSVFAITIFATAAAPQVEAKRMGGTIVDAVLADDGEFDVLQTAVVKAGLVDALNSNKQLTVFAPTDEAFINSLGVTSEAEAIDAINSLEEDTLAGILLYHVTHGRRDSESVIDASQYKMLNGERLTQEELFAAGIVATDISTSNGIIHVIDSVLGL